MPISEDEAGSNFTMPRGAESRELIQRMGECPKKSLQEIKYILVMSNLVG